MAESAIEWTERTLNPWTGCTKVSPGCAKCYIPRTPPFRAAGRRFVKGHIPLVFHMERLERMVRRRKPTMYFVNSLSDVFHEDASDAQIAQVWTAMARAPQHTFQILTKRPERMRDCLRGMAWELPGDGSRGEATIYRPSYGIPATPLPNVWCGVSIENRRFVHRADVLRDTPAAVRFISAEPLLGPLVCRDGAFFARGADGHYHRDWPDGYVGEDLDLAGIDWLIVGGESGPGHRTMDLQWARDLRDACAEPILSCCRMRDELGRCCGQPDNDGPRTAFFVKQIGGHRPGTRLEDLPEDLRIREMPPVRT